MGRDEKSMTLDSAMMKSRTQQGKKAGRERLGSSTVGSAPPTPAPKVAAKPSTPVSPEETGGGGGVGGATSCLPNSSPPAPVASGEEGGRGAEDSLPLASTRKKV